MPESKDREKVELALLHTKDPHYLALNLEQRKLLRDLLELKGQGAAGNAEQIKELSKELFLSLTKAVGLSETGSDVLAAIARGENQEFQSIDTNVCDIRTSNLLGKGRHKLFYSMEAYGPGGAQTKPGTEIMYRDDPKISHGPLLKSLMQTLGVPPELLKRTADR